jgi:hypothetical protein
MYIIFKKLVYQGGLSLDELMFRLTKTKKKNLDVQIFFFKKKIGLSITKRLTYTLIINLFFYSILHSLILRVMIDSNQFNN